MPRLPDEVAPRLADLIPQQVWTATPAGDLDFVNERVCDYFGLDAATFLGQGWRAVVHPEDLDRVITVWRRSLRTGEPYELQFRLRRSDGVYRRHIGRALALHENGRIVKWYGTNTDIEDEQALRRSDAMKTALLRAVSHDLRSPLTSIATAAEAALSASVTVADQRDLAAVVLAEARRLSSLVDKLLDLSRLQGGAAAPKTEWCSVAEIVEVTLQRLGPDGADVVLDVDPDVPLVHVDETQVERALSNIIDNARRYAGAEGRVRVTAGVDDAAVDVRVCDAGPGIDPAEHERVFEPFYRCAAPAGRTEGSGIGLAIARGFVEANGGTVRIEPTPSRPGTTVLVELPVSDP